MERNDTWHLFDEGSILGQGGSEGGTVVRDEEYAGSTRITLERDAGRIPFAITCGIYGWMMHTRFFSTKAEAERALVAIVDRIPQVDDPRVEIKMPATEDQIEGFIERFP